MTLEIEDFDTLEAYRLIADFKTHEDYRSWLYGLKVATMGNPTHTDSIDEMLEYSLIDFLMAEHAVKSEQERVDSYFKELDDRADLSYDRYYEDEWDKELLLDFDELYPLDRDYVDVWKERWFEAWKPAPLNLFPFFYFGLIVISAWALVLKTI